MSRPVVRHDDGAVIVEFAVVFVLFMTLLWGLVSYGTIFAVEQSLTHATAEATRASVGLDTESAVEAAVDAVLDQQLDWLGGLAGAGMTRSFAWADCDPGNPATRRCVSVTVTYDWANHALVPSLLDVVTPDTLSASAVLASDVE